MEGAGSAAEVVGCAAQALAQADRNLQAPSQSSPRGQPNALNSSALKLLHPLLASAALATPCGARFWSPTARPGAPQPPLPACSCS